MNFPRNPLVISLFCGVFLVACGSSSSKSNDGGGSGGGTGTAGGPKICGTGTTNTCTAAERNTYETCVQNACNATYTSCLGPNYKTGSYSGVCASYITCLNACPCNDTACLIACGAPSDACVTCLGQGECGMTCTQPACYSMTGSGTGGRSGSGTGGTSGGGTGGAPATGTACAELLACCNASTNATLRMMCTQAVTMSEASDAACAASLTNLKAFICP